VFPLLAANRNPKLSIRAYDYSNHAIKLVQVRGVRISLTIHQFCINFKTDPLYLSPPIGTVHASVWDLTSETLPDGLEPNSVDIVVLIFVLSALHPDEWEQAVGNVHKVSSRTFIDNPALYVTIGTEDIETWWSCCLP
jgi:tRNAThr (cytosine32-N3)-methyltransferase